MIMMMLMTMMKSYDIKFIQSGFQTLFGGKNLTSNRYRISTTVEAHICLYSGPEKVLVTYQWQ